MDLFDLVIAKKLAGGGGGGGGSSYTLLASGEVTFNTNPSTSAVEFAAINIGSEGYTGDKLIYVEVRLKTTGSTQGKYIGSDWWITNSYAANGYTDPTALTMRTGHEYYRITAGVKPWMSVGKSGIDANGIYPNIIKSDGTLSMYVKYDSTYGSFVGTYTYNVYALEWPNNITPFF